MTDPIEFEEVDELAAGAVGEPGEREFFIQARTAGSQLTVLVEKEQIAILAREALAFLNRLDDDFPAAATGGDPAGARVREPTVPLFRARVIGLGFDLGRQRVLIELREHAEDDEPESDEGALADLFGEAGVPREAGSADPDSPEGYVARVYATREQVKVMAEAGAAAVAAGRPPCQLCGQPVGPGRHICPRLN